MNSVVKKFKKQEANRNDVLKLIAIITMLIDHIGFFFFPDEDIFRHIGRLSLPIFAYLITIGYTKTSNFKGYILRLLKFGLLTQAPYFLLTLISRGKMGYNPFTFNIFFTLALGLYGLKIYDFYKVQRGYKKPLLWLGLVLYLALPRLLSLVFMRLSLPYIEGVYAFSIDYGSYGLILILLFYVYRNNLVDTLLAFLLLSYFHGYLEDMIALSGIWDEASAIVRFQKLFDIAVLEPITLPFAANCPRPLALLILNRLIAMLTFAPKYSQFYAVFAIFIIYALKDVSFKFRMPRNFAYWFYPIHLLILGLINFLIKNGLL